MDRTICQKRIAERLGLSQSTVSLALRKQPGVNPKTVERVHAMARELGYVPDPMLGSLARYRSRNRKAVFRSVLPWLHTDLDLAAHRPDLPWGRVLRGARERAVLCGYKLEPMWVGGKDYQPENFIRMLHARGIAGALCGPSLSSPVWIKTFAELDFPVVSVAVYSFSEVEHIHVAADHYQNARKLAQIVEEKGYRRILVILSDSLERILLKQYSSLFRRLALEDKRSARWHLCDLRDTDSITGRMQAVNPDLIIMPGIDQYRILQRTLPDETWKAVQEVPVALLCLLDSFEHPAGCCGIDEQLQAIGAASVDQLSNLIATWRLNPNPPSIRVLIEGRWVQRCG